MSPYQNHPIQKMVKEHLKISSSTPLLASNHQQQDIEVTPLPTTNLAEGEEPLQYLLAMFYVTRLLLWIQWDSQG